MNDNEYSRKFSLLFTSTSMNQVEKACRYSPYERYHCKNLFHFIDVKLNIGYRIGLFKSMIVRFISLCNHCESLVI